MKATRRVSQIGLSILFVFAQLPGAVAQVVNPMAAPPTVSAVASEFFVGRELGKPLISVHLVSGVNKPGVYHVPMGTDLAQLIAYAGGAMEKADLGEVSVRRRDDKGYSVMMVDMEKILIGTATIPPVQSEDVVHIPLKISVERSLTWVSLISGIVSIGLSVAIIQDVNRRND
ncbi:MAG: SLBB domain-containing protein [Bdellovibrionaceae bacterium]|nr:SLBB domain-containing protein [Bdellovibrionales bacterium]MCB9084607.1 SLBB domain-containing protein [Pseudobdellovibrionaceae bacterium]